MKLQASSLLMNVSIAASTLSTGSSIVIKLATSLQPEYFYSVQSSFRFPPALSSAAIDKVGLGLVLTFDQEVDTSGDCYQMFSSSV